MEIDWNDLEGHDALDARVARVLGWKHKDDNRLIWWDYESNANPDFGVSPDGVFPVFRPSRETDHALFAAGKIVDKRGLGFSLGRRTDGFWRAVFAIGRDEISGVDAFPEKAICEAILKLERIPDRNRLFKPLPRRG
jgi:hypothetical protein